MDKRDDVIIPDDIEAKYVYGPDTAEKKKYWEEREKASEAAFKELESWVHKKDSPYNEGYSIKMNGIIEGNFTDEVSKELAKRAEQFPEQEMFGLALNLLLTHDEDKEELIRRIDSGELADSGEILQIAVAMQEKRDEEAER